MNNKILVSSLILFLTSFSLNAQIQSGTNSGVSSFEAFNLINVTIGGDFPMSGTYPASRTERVDQLITRLLVEYRAEIMRSTPDEQLLSLLRKRAEDIAMRNILLKRLSGEEINIDLMKFRITGDFNYNPYLNNDDVLIFPPLDLDKNFVVITGAVNKETKFEFVEGERLFDAILLAHGLNPAYENIENVRISRLSGDGNTESDLIVAISSNPLLKRGDRITVLSDENKKGDYSVLVLGEVKNPGKIFISKNNTTLKEAIEIAGGFTEDASLKFAELLRDFDSYSTLRKNALEENFYNNVQNLENQNFLSEYRRLEYLKMYRAAELVMGDTLFFGIDNQLRGFDGHSSLDFRNLQDDSSFESSYIVNDGDVIVVPEISNEVYVWGGVSQIGYYEYDENLSAWDYIDKAGGYTEIAYGSDEVYLIKGKSRDWRNVEDNENLIIEPGDFIYVKKEVPRDTQFYISRVAAYASIIGSIATVVLLLNQIGK